LSTITITIMIIIYYVIILVTQRDLSSSPEPATVQLAPAATLSNCSPVAPPVCVLDEEALSGTTFTYDLTLELTFWFQDYSYLLVSF
jgi:hypothetical protein